MKFKRRLAGITLFSGVMFGYGLINPFGNPDVRQPLWLDILLIVAGLSLFAFYMLRMHACSARGCRVMRGNKEAVIGYSGRRLRWVRLCDKHATAYHVWMARLSV